MAMAANEIEALIKAALPDAKVTVEDLAGDGDHYAANVVSEQFRGVSRVRQHQIVSFTLLHYRPPHPNNGIRRSSTAWPTRFQSVSRGTSPRMM
jgi:acid stress-induced BolA-like protein IbaG/YrbA